MARRAGRRSSGWRPSWSYHDLGGVARASGATRARRRLGPSCSRSSVTLPGSLPGRLCLCGARRRGRVPGREAWRHGALVGRRRPAGACTGAAGVDMKGGVDRRRCARARRAARARRPRRSCSVRDAVGGGRRARRVRGARTRRPLRRLPDPGADGGRRRLRPGRRALRSAAPSAAAPPTRRCGSRASSAIDRYVRGARRAGPSTSAASTRTCGHAAMRDLALPYPLSVGRVCGGRVVEHRARPARLRGPPRRARGGGPRRRRARRSRRPGATTSRSSGPAARSRRAETDPEHPWVRRVLDGGPRGARLGRDRRRPLGRRHAPLHGARHPGGHGRHERDRLAHAVDERVSLDDARRPWRG